MREMKDSGVEWIGEIPEDWMTGKTIYALQMPITDGPHETPELYDEGVPFVSAEAVSCGNGHIDFDHIRGYISREFYKECCKKYIPRVKDIYMIKSGATTGKVALVEENRLFTIWSPLAVFRCKEEKCYYKYLFYFLQSDAYQKQIENKWTYGTQQNIGMRMLEKLLICFPPIKEQARIAKYLDEKCTRIDVAIEKQQSIIEKLKEYKLSVINEVLTHGLEETRNYKESGIDWIGKIPEHWSIQKLKTIVDILPGYAFSSNDFATDEGIPLLRGINVVPSGIRWNDVVFWNQEVPKYLEPYYLQENDIVVGLDRPWISDGMRTTIMNKDSLPCLLLQRVCRIRLKKECAYDHRLIYHWINSKAFESALSIETTGVSVPHISTKQIENFIIALPPNEEARSICDYLHVKTCEIDKSISIRSQLIGKLLDYKKSLIYEVVTGKREV